MSWTGMKTSNEVEKLAERKSEGKSLQVGGVQMALDLLVSQVLMKENKQKTEVKKSKVAGGKQVGVFRYGKMVQWRNIQEEIDNMWEKLSKKLGKKHWRWTTWR